MRKLSEPRGAKPSRLCHELFCCCRSCLNAESEQKTLWLRRDGQHFTGALLSAWSIFKSAQGGPSVLVSEELGGGGSLLLLINKKRLRASSSICSSCGGVEGLLDLRCILPSSARRCWQGVCQEALLLAEAQQDICNPYHCSRCSGETRVQAGLTREMGLRPRNW